MRRMLLVLALSPITAFGQTSHAGLSHVGRWAVSKTVNPMSDDTSRMIFIKASEPLNLDFPYNQTPWLAITCDNNVTKLFITVGVPVDRGDVRTRADGAAPESYSWRQNDKTLFSLDPVTLAKQLATVRKWVFEFYPAAGPPQAVVFDLTGLSTVLPRISKPCLWT
jgi:hypothetical protein